MVDSADIAHLLRRTEFVARPARVTALSALPTLSAAVDDVLDFTPNANPQLPAYLTTDDDNDSWGQYVYAYDWWIDSMVARPRPMQEKMTLFWHGHFTSGWWESVGSARHMLHQNQLYRLMALGNFRTLTHAMALEPAMLIYLNNADNRKDAPNQNFARELLELFTLGVGNYTEDDVEAAARAWTGHNVTWPERDYVFDSSEHDSDPKTFFGTTKNWDGPDIIDEVLRDNPTKRLIAARYITKKLWDFFAYPGAPSTVINELADVFVAGDFELKPLLKALLTHAEFYTTKARQGLVRTPTDWLVALSFSTGFPAEYFGGSWMGEQMGQSLFNPPNVSGWRPNAFWLNTSALNSRGLVAESVANRLRNTPDFEHLDTPTPVGDAVDFVADFFGITPLSTTTRDAMIASHQAVRQVEGASWWAPLKLLNMAMLAPEMHMA